MGMGTHVVGIRDLDGKFAKMIELKHACERASVPYPKEVVTYLNNCPSEDEDYLRREMEEIEIEDAVAQDQYDATDAWTVDLSKLPKECKAIRFCNSY